MSAYVVSFGISEKSVVMDLKKDPKYRKATGNMLWALDGAQKALQPLEHIDRDLFHLVLGTSHGELETTKEFLNGMENGGAPRPFLFQNSLHNATSGFLAVQLGIKGASVTVSQSQLTGEKTIEAAMLLLHRPTPAFVLTVAVEGHVESLSPATRANYPEKINLCAGAASIILANKLALEQFNLPSHGQIKDVSYESKSPRLLEGNYYDSNAIEELIQNLQKAKSGIGNLHLQKPDGQQSIFHLEST